MQREEVEVTIPDGDRGLVVIEPDRCKGCGLCVRYCPPEVLNIGSSINVQGYRPAHYSEAGCTGCAICFYVCPEPGAISVYRQEARR